MVRRAAQDADLKDLRRRTNLILDRDHGLRFDERIYLRYAEAGYAVDSDNTTGDHGNFGSGTFTVQDSGVNSAVNVSIAAGLNVGPSVAGAAAGEILVGGSNSQRGSFTSSATATYIGSKDNLPLSFMIGNAAKVQITTGFHLIPLGHNTQDSGAVATAWRNGYYGTGVNVGPAVTGAASGEVLVGTSNSQRGSFISTGTATFIGSKDVLPLSFMVGNAAKVQITTTPFNLIPLAHNSQDLGAVATAWKGGYFGTGLNVGPAVTGAVAGEILVGPDNTHRGTFASTATATSIGSKDAFPLWLMVGNAQKVAIDATGHVTPFATNTQDLGSVTGPLAWRTAYFGTTVFIGDTTNANMTVGLTLNQGAADNQILAMKSSDVAHGFTSDLETDSYGYMGKANATNGGTTLVGASEANRAVYLQGWATSEDTSSASTSTDAHVRIAGWTSNGSGSSTSPASGAFIVALSAGGATKFAFRADGNSYQDGTGWTAYDSEDDIALTDAVDRTLDPRLRAMMAGNAAWLREHENELERLDIVSFNRDTDGVPFINTSRLAMLHNGALRLAFRRIETLERRLMEAG